MNAPQLRIHLFGEVRAEYDGRPVRIAARPLCAVLLAMLAVRPGSRIARKALTAELWPDEGDPVRANGNLRRHLSALQGALPELPGGTGWIEADGTTLTWPAERPFWCDAVEFASALVDPDADPRIFAEAGEFMAGYANEWVVAERENVRARAVERLLAICIERQDEDRIDEALACATAVLRIDPLCEEAVQLAIELHGENGDAVAAGQTYAAFAERLRRELDARPGAATVAAMERIRGATAASRERLPRASTTFVGRGAAVEDIESALERSRCVTIAGPGGAGKTRLSLEAARAIARRFIDGSYFVDLSAGAGPQGIEERIVHAFALPSELAGAGLDGVKRFLRNRRALIILDNCEHVVAEAAALAAALLESAPRIALLATSREALGIGAEAVYRLGPLTAGEARALFVERSRNAGAGNVAQDDLARIDRICATLDRSPLAIELAAGLCRTMGVADVERRLADRFAMLRTSDPSLPERHRTLEATIAWSFERLEPAEQRLFERLAVFPAGFTFDAALAIGEATAAAFIGLVEKSMVQREEGNAERYRLLLSLAEFARHRLERDEGAEGCRERHARHYAELTFFAETQAYFHGAPGWLESIERELENVRAALAHLLATQTGAPHAVRAILALERFFNTRGYCAEGLGWLERAASHTPAGSREFALVRSRMARLLLRARRFAEARDAGAEAVALFRGAGAERDLACALADLGAITISLRDFPAARALLDEALRRAEREGITDTRAAIHSNLGTLAMAAGDTAGAKAMWTEAARLAKRAGDRGFVARMLDNLASLEFAAGRSESALRLLDDALDAVRAAGDRPATGNVLRDAGEVLLTCGRVGEARARFGEALAIANGLGLSYGISQALLGFAAAAAADDDPATAARLIGAATACGLAGDLRPLSQIPLYERTRRAGIERLGQDGYEREVGFGELLEFDAVLRLAAGNVPGAVRR